MASFNDMGAGLGTQTPPRRYLPHCLQDELPDYWVDESGRPKFQPAAERNGDNNSPHPLSGAGHEKKI
jgi:hypothetical protein